MTSSQAPSSGESFSQSQMSFNGQSTNSKPNTDKQPGKSDSKDSKITREDKNATGGSAKCKNNPETVQIKPEPCTTTHNQWSTEMVTQQNGRTDDPEPTAKRMRFVEASYETGSAVLSSHGHNALGHLERDDISAFGVNGYQLQPCKTEESW